MLLRHRFVVQRIAMVQQATHTHRILVALRCGQSLWAFVERVARVDILIDY